MLSSLFCTPQMRVVCRILHISNHYKRNPSVHWRNTVAPNIQINRPVLESFYFGYHRCEPFRPKWVVFIFWFLGDSWGFGFQSHSINVWSMLITLFLTFVLSFSLQKNWRLLSSCSSFDSSVRRRLKHWFATCCSLATVSLGRTYRPCDIHYGDQWLDQQWAQPWARRWAQHITQRQTHWINRPYFHRITSHRNHSARISRIFHLPRIDHTRVIAA